jgi:mannose-6-phosphate isomerase-like protein (cupin superfamily)
MIGNHMIDNELSGGWLQSRPGKRFSIRVPASATNGYYSVTEILSSPGDSTPVYLHQNEDKYILVVEGTARVLYGDKTFDATAGTMISPARAIRHAWENPTDTAIPLMITARPGGVEEVLRLIATSGDQLIYWRFLTNTPSGLSALWYWGAGHREWESIRSN